jgi:DNA invertase Pin-like site-specific DNA recombinase
MGNAPVISSSGQPGPERMHRAAQYVRMSTDMQRYSTENQKDAIAAYAERRGLTIVRTYADEGCSGVDINGRAALQRLLEDVKCGDADFGLILVYDVSRWGRFQDADESAYYEFICKEAGVHVLYCAELFENDGSLPATLLKALKRAMAAEFVRELSTKVFIGQSRIARMGFWRGGFPAYGLRRQLVDETGRSKGQLERGTRKSIQTDRIVLVHGPAIEVATVRRIFSSFVDDRKSERRIAAELNGEGLSTLLGNQWDPGSITKLLANESYRGHIVFNRTSMKLGRLPAVRNPPEMWIRRDNAFPPIVEEKQFRTAQEILAERRQGRSAESLVQRLAAVRLERGFLTARLINADDDLPSAQTLHRQYGSLVNAYKLIDYQPARSFRRTEIATARRSIVEATTADIAHQIAKLGTQVDIDEKAHLLRIDGDLAVSICAARATPERLGRMRWYAHVDRHAKSDLTLVLRVSLAGTGIDACYLLPTAELARAKRSRIRITDKTFVEACRYECIDAFCRMCGGLEERRAT